MKTRKQEIGNKGEQRAVDYLKSQGHQIKHQNYRYKRAEIDIISELDGCLHFIEVKTRKNDDYGYPEEFVSERKQELFIDAADDYIDSNNWNGDVQFDIIAITNDTKSIHYIENAFN